MAAGLSKSPNTKITIQLTEQYKQRGGIKTPEMGVGSGGRCRGKHGGKHWFEGSDESNRALGPVPRNKFLGNFAG